LRDSSPLRVYAGDRYGQQPLRRLLDERISRSTAKRELFSEYYKNYL
jgi:hypothetical protein